jgi:hypothetical protein
MGWLACDKVTAMRILFLLPLAAAALFAADPPQSSISNGLVEVKVFLPDPMDGYYRGTRFDWSGQISSLTYRGHNWFGQWNEKADPLLHDSIMGPVEDFRTRGAGLGFDEAKAGGNFVRIGVGVVRRPDDAAYQAFHTYEIVDPGYWKVNRSADAIAFTHTLTGPNGYAYVYRKTLRLAKGKPTLTILHWLRNTGEKTIETSQYNHNFFVMDGQPTGPDTSVTFRFAPRAARDLKGLAEVAGKQIVYKKELAKGESVFTEIEGFGKSKHDYDVRLENRKAGTGVRITGDRPIAKMNYWSIRSTVCPEPYIDLKVEPGRETTWAYTYEFYTLQ